MNPTQAVVRPGKMRILVINPDTTQSMTEMIADRAHPETEILALTSSPAPVSIEGYYDEVFAMPLHSPILIAACWSHSQPKA